MLPYICHKADIVSTDEKMLAFTLEIDRQYKYCLEDDYRKIAMRLPYYTVIMLCLKIPGKLMSEQLPIMRLSYLNYGTVQYSQYSLSAVWSYCRLASCFRNVERSTSALSSLQEWVVEWRLKMSHVIHACYQDMSKFHINIVIIDQCHVDHGAVQIVLVKIWIYPQPKPCCYMILLHKVFVNISDLPWMRCQQPTCHLGVAYLLTAKSIQSVNCSLCKTPGSFYWAYINSLPAMWN